MTVAIKMKISKTQLRRIIREDVWHVSQEDLRMAIEKYYNENKYTSGVYSGSYKKKFNQQYRPENVLKEIDKYLSHIEDEKEQQHFLANVHEYFLDPSLARGYSIVPQAFEDTFGNDEEDEYWDDEEEEW